MCANMMKEEESDDDEIARETGIIRVQAGFAIQMQGGGILKNHIFNMVVYS